MNDKEICPLCKKDGMLLRATDIFEHNEELIEIVECIECSAKFANIYKFDRMVSLNEILRGD
jgi:hypothetical protein